MILVMAKKIEPNMMIVILQFVQMLHTEWERERVLWIIVERTPSIRPRKHQKRKHLCLCVFLEGPWWEGEWDFMTIFGNEIGFGNGIVL